MPSFPLHAHPVTHKPESAAAAFSTEASPSVTLRGKPHLPELLWTFTNLGAPLTRALFFSRRLPPLTPFAPPLDIVAGLLRPRSSFSDVSIELLDLQVCSSSL